MPILMWIIFLDGVQFFLLPVVLGSSLLSMGIANTLYAISFGWYFYLTHLGYRGESIYTVHLYFNPK